MKLIVVATAICNDKNEVLLLRRAKGKSWEGKWNFPGGKYDPEDKSLAVGAKREVFEESGLTINNLTFIGKVNFDKLDVYFYWSNDFSGDVKINDESDEFQWVKLSNLLEYDFPMNRKLNDSVYKTITKLCGE
jgi:8-oxo-dGTP diphosphatase